MDEELPNDLRKLNRAAEASPWVSRGEAAMRLFIALPTDRAAREALRNYQAVLRTLGLRGGETRPENLHITLAFLGEKPDPAPVIEAMKAVKTFGPVSLTLDRPGRFQQRDGALLWLGSSRDRPVQRLAAALENELRSRGFPLQERQYQTHITLFRRVKNADILPRLPEICIPYRADNMVLYHSHKLNGVLTYTPLYVQEL